MDTAGVSGTICLQGGAEFGPTCREMDAGILDGSGGGPVVVLPLASRPGREYAAAAANGMRHFRALGAQASAPPDYSDDLDAVLTALAEAALLVLPGGSPSRLRTALVGTPIGEAVGGLLSRGGTVMGASAGAMVLCEVMWLPDGGGRVVGGLGYVPGVLVLPHYVGPPAPVAAPAGIDLLGLPECTGVVVRECGMVAVGAGRPVRIRPDGSEDAV